MPILNRSMIRPFSPCKIRRVACTEVHLLDFVWALWSCHLVRFSAAVLHAAARKYRMNFLWCSPMARHWPCMAENTSRSLTWIFSYTPSSLIVSWPDARILNRVVHCHCRPIASPFPGPPRNPPGYCFRWRSLWSPFSSAPCLFCLQITSTTAATTKQISHMLMSAIYLSNAK